MVIYAPYGAKESQGFEPWEATNLSSFQDYHHQPLGQLSNITIILYVV